VFAKLIVDAPLEQPLDYRLAGDEAHDELLGSVCVVPLGRREVIGVIVGISQTSEIDEPLLRSVLRVMREVAPLSPAWLALTRFAAEYYQQGWGELAIPALPPALRVPPGPRFAGSLKRLRAGPAAAVAACESEPAITLTEDQRTACVAIDAARGFAPLLLFGVTGSGKTEVYLEAMARRLADDPAAQVLLLVPEINLTPQLQARLQRRFPSEPLVTMHSGLAAGERSAAWLAAHEGRARLVLGTRLAVFASLPRLAMIVVDEEHDPSFKAGDGARYSARDLAIKRAQDEGVPIVLGSATPSLETWSRASEGRYRLLELRTRTPATAEEASAASVSAAAGPGEARPASAPGDWPVLQTIDLRTHPAPQGLTEPVRSALAQVLARGEQSLVFINRRGYAPVISCEACGWLSGCPQCAVFTAFHKTDGTLRCHHCGWQARVPRACPTCGNTDLHAVGQGTQRIEEALQALLPDARVARIDRDSTSRKLAAQAAFDAVHAGDVDILVGTQMVSKGHDFRRVSLVAVLNVDAQLIAPDFRAPERLFATLLQVAGRAGRAGLASRVLVQTRFPDHALLAAVARHDFAAFARRQLAERRSAALPPFVHQALLTAEGRTLEAPLAFLMQSRDLAGEPEAHHRVRPGADAAGQAGRHASRAVADRVAAAIPAAGQPARLAAAGACNRAELQAARTLADRGRPAADLACVRAAVVVRGRNLRAAERLVGRLR
jgi:primosomal protein N' (replication factor Y) (superfamily II helicase)